MPLLAPIVVSALLSAPAAGCAGVTDGILCLPLPGGWSGSVGPGVVSGRPAAWLLAGNFRFPRDAASHEGGPYVPTHRTLISIGDFPLSTGRWTKVRHLRLPPAVGQSISWRVRFAGRALFITVRFGSKPGLCGRALVNRRLAAVRRLA